MGLLLAVAGGVVFTPACQVAKFFREEGSAEARRGFMMGALAGAMPATLFVTSMGWMLYNVVKGDRHRKCAYCMGIAIAFCYVVEVGLLGMRPLFFSVVLLVGEFVMLCCVPGGSR